MSERKVLQKYYPPGFDPRDIARRRGPKQKGPRIQTVRLMAPFSMRCMTCGEFIYKGRKFNSRKETNFEERYLGLQIFFFHIKCTRCSAEITFRTDPKNNDYAMVKGAVRNMEPWRNRDTKEETMEQRLDRLEREEAEAAGEEEKNAMADLEAKNADARREMAVADALDEIRYRNARINRSEKEGVDYADLVVRAEDEELARQDREDEEAARRAFAAFSLAYDIEVDEESATGSSMSDDLMTGRPPTIMEESMSSSTSSIEPAMAAPVPTFKRVVKKKKNHSALLGIKKKPTLV
ncbi:pre-mRNA-splicing factor cwf16 [Hirsutella rhossiliensis]|uniref:Splicing factor YJU2 n=1 Tax=Hirsutella rhossiliensis TaxID=111463 RepID=A0A9P8SJ53_9HYPO|nr:pre-mRNA-splicing factor cwf16 [Hirsutella rhossiliensis]KAH0964938.1 pre-mRNA-splicing factor cwf16 [Hirsutella rhossiliensis]